MNLTENARVRGLCNYKMTTVCNGNLILTEKPVIPSRYNSLFDLLIYDSSTLVFIKISVFLESILGQYSSSVLSKPQKNAVYYWLSDKTPNYHLKHVQSCHEINALPNLEGIKSSEFRKFPNYLVREPIHYVGCSASEKCAPEVVNKWAKEKMTLTQAAIVDFYLNNFTNWNVQFRHKSSCRNVQFGQAALQVIVVLSFPPANVPRERVDLLWISSEIKTSKRLRARENISAWWKITVK